jgi:cellulose synthase/poly-beta-1,6-N-acetylglucosamine synthase-like glycosyltransferase
VTGVLVAVPARDEEHRVARCLDSVAASLRHARDSGVVRRAAVAVAVHRSSDGTDLAVEQWRAATPGVEVFHHLDDEATTVGEVRHRLVTAACTALGIKPAHDDWVFSTDADSVVPLDWVTGILGHADRTGAHCVTGLVDLDGWRAHPGAAAAYERIVQDGLDEAGHRHVYGANLAVRLDAYAAAGGFPPHAHGEDHALVARVRTSGGRVVPACAPVVRTSARMPGRARHGLGDLLHGLVSGVPVPRSAVPGGCACCAG